MTTPKKMGFVDSFMAHNVNISSPDTSAKWSTLIQYIRKNSFHLIEIYGNSSQIQKVIYIAESENIPDALFEFSKNLLMLIEFHKATVKNDIYIFDAVKQFAEVAKSSYDKRIIDLASNIVEELSNLQN